MGVERLTLPTTGGRLWRTVRDPIANALNGLHGAPYECRLGGGTALAARWRHRDSFDIDLTVATRVNLRSLPDDFEETMRRMGGKPEYLVGRWVVTFDIGQVDLTALDPCPSRGQETAMVDGEPMIVLSNAQILHGKLERASRSPVRDVFDVIVAGRRDPDALAIAVNCRNRMDAEAICVGWEKSNAMLQREADSQLLGLADGDRDHRDIGRRGAAALDGAIYRHVTVDSDHGLTVIETRTRSGRARRFEIPPNEIDVAFAVNGLDDHFRQNVMGGERMRDAAREASDAREEAALHWRTGQTAPALQERTARPPRTS